MARSNWKHIRARSMTHAMELCVDYAREKHNRYPENIADMMGLASTSTLYKWLSSGRMPAINIRSFEHICGIDFVTQYLAYSSNKLIIDMPSGRKSEHRELTELGAFTHKVMASLIDFYDGQCEQQEAMDALASLIEDLAHQRGNIEKHQQPELI